MGNIQIVEIKKNKVKFLKINIYTKKIIKIVKMYRNNKEEVYNLNILNLKIEV